VAHHADELEEGEKLKLEVAHRFNCAQRYLTGLTPIMGVHAAPGILAIAFCKDEVAATSVGAVGSERS